MFALINEFTTEHIRSIGLRQIGNKLIKFGEYSKHY